MNLNIKLNQKFLGSLNRVRLNQTLRTCKQNDFTTSHVPAAKACNKVAFCCCQ